MTPQERQLVDDLFDRLSKLENAPRDPDAAAAIAQGLRIAPNAIYALVQTVLLQDEALKRANGRIQELEQELQQALERGQAGQQSQSGGFLDSMRDSIFGKNEQRGSVPNVPPPVPNRPVWNSGQVLQQTQGPGRSPYDQGSYGGQPYGGPPSAFGGGGSSFLGTAAATAAGMVGGSLLLNSIRSMMGGSHQGFGDATAMKDRAASPSSDQSDSSLARDAGIDDIGSNRDRGDDTRHAGLYDQASNDDNQSNYDTASNYDDQDDTDLDSDDFGGDNDGGSDYA
jgi:hypothetical protein